VSGRFRSSPVFVLLDEPQVNRPFPG
jgi:hypothetical protein